MKWPRRKHLRWAKARYRFPQHQIIWKRGISWTVRLPQDVVVDQQGNASPNPVTFYYVKAQEPTPVAQATITIRYTDVKGNQIAPTETRMLDANNVYAIAPDPSRVPSDYLPLKADTVSVTVNAEGVADVTEVVFVYQPKVTETEIPTGALIQRWGYTTAEKGSINWRDEPSTDGRRLGALNPEYVCVAAARRSEQQRRSLDQGAV